MYINTNIYNYVYTYKGGARRVLIRTDRVYVSQRITRRITWVYVAGAVDFCRPRIDMLYII